MKLSNLEKIREAWRIGWAAVVKDEYGEIKIVDVAPLVVCGVFPDHTSASILVDNLEGVQILRYLYAGELAGNEEPREGQKFRNKNHGGILEYLQRHVYPDQGGDCGELYALMPKIIYEPLFD